MKAVSDELFEDEYGFEQRRTTDQAVGTHVIDPSWTI